MPDLGNLLRCPTSSTKIIFFETLAFSTSLPKVFKYVVKIVPTHLDGPISS